MATALCAPCVQPSSSRAIRQRSHVSHRVAKHHAHLLAGWQRVACECKLEPAGLERHASELRVRRTTPPLRVYPRSGGTLPLLRARRSVYSDQFMCELGRTQPRSSRRRCQQTARRSSSPRISPIITRPGACRAPAVARAGHIVTVSWENHSVESPRPVTMTQALPRSSGQVPESIVQGQARFVLHARCFDACRRQDLVCVTRRLPLRMLRTLLLARVVAAQRESPRMRGQERAE